MPKFSIKAGSASKSVNVLIQDSSSTTGQGLSGLVFNTSNLAAYYTFTGANATATAITLATLAAVNSAWSSGGFKELDATHLKGVYRLDLPNAVLASASGQTVLVYLYGATNMAPCVLEIELTATDNQDVVRGGMTALPNAAAGITGGLATLGLGGHSGTAQAGAAQTITLDAGASSTDSWYSGDQVYISSGTGAGQLATIDAYTGSSRVAHVSIPWAVNPDNTSVFTTIPTAKADVHLWNGGSTSGTGLPVVTLDMTQAVPTGNTDETVGDALNAARAQGFGKWVITGTTLDLYAADGTTVVHSFTLDSSSAPTQRS